MFRHSSQFSTRKDEMGNFGFTLRKLIWIFFSQEMRGSETFKPSAPGVNSDKQKIFQNKIYQ